MIPSPLVPPNLRADLPTYPVHQQILRVTGGTISGPSGYASSSVLGPSLHVAFVEQITDTLLTRDREPCLVLSLDGRPLAPGYYIGRLSHSYQSLPVYAVGGAPMPLPGLTIEQAIALSTLSTTQLNTLNNLNPCQLQTLLTSLQLSDIQLLTNELTPTQLTNLVDQLTTTQLTSLYNQLTLSQIIFLTSSLNQQQVGDIATVLTPAQINTLTGVLTQEQLQLLVRLPPGDLDYLITNTTTSQITNTLNNLTATQTKRLFTLTAAQIVNLITDFSITQLKTLLDITLLPNVIPSDINTQTGTSYTVVPGDLGRLVTLNNNSAIAVTLPSASSVGSGWYTTIQNIGTGTATLTPTIGTINGAASLSVPGGQGSAIYSDGSNWQISTPIAGATGIGSGSGVATGSEATIAATGSVQGDAAELTADNNKVTGADGTKGVRLKDVAGSKQLVWNPDTVFNLNVYPPSGARINGGAADVPSVVGAQEVRLFCRIDSIHWSFVSLQTLID